MKTHNDLKRSILRGATPMELWSEFADEFGWATVAEMAEDLQTPLEGAWNDLPMSSTLQVPDKDGTNENSRLCREVKRKDSVAGSGSVWIMVSDLSGFTLTDMKPATAPMYPIPDWDGKKGKRTGPQVKRLSEHWRRPVRAKATHEAPDDYYRGPKRQV